MLSRLVLKAGTCDDKPGFLENDASGLTMYQQQGLKDQHSVFCSTVLYYSVRASGQFTPATLHPPLYSVEASSANKAGIPHPLGLMDPGSLPRVWNDKRWVNRTFLSGMTG